MPRSTDIGPVCGLSDNSKRSIVIFTKSDTDIARYLQELSESERNQMYRSFDYWLNGYDTKKNRHHGWDRSQFGGEFQTLHVFKAGAHRIYGIKLNPRCSGFMACVLVGVFEKHEQEAPEQLLRSFVTRYGSTIRRPAEVFFAT